MSGNTYDIPSDWHSSLATPSTSSASQSATSALLLEFDPLESPSVTDSPSAPATLPSSSASTRSPPPASSPPGQTSSSLNLSRPSSINTISSFRSKSSNKPHSEKEEHDKDREARLDKEGDPSDNRVQTAQFDFPKFLEQLKSKPAEPVAKYLKSFLMNFAKKSFSMNEMIKLIHDFLQFISARMREVPPWKGMSELEFDTALDCMEKLVMNRLHPFTFTPVIDSSKHHITTDDLERDKILHQRIGLFGWLEGKHLDVLNEDDLDRDQVEGYLKFAMDEMIKMNHYKAPRDKLICILNSCKVIFGMIRQLSANKNSGKKAEGSGADTFIPILILVVLKANPEHLISNVEYINRFRSASKLQSEAGYYLSSLMGSITFIESMDHTVLSNITQQEFEMNVESAIAHLPPNSPLSPTVSGFKSSISPFPPPASSSSSAVAAAAASAPFGNTSEGEEPANIISFIPTNFALGSKRFFAKTGEAVTRPLGAIGKLFTDVIEGGLEDSRPSSASGSRPERQLGGGPSETQRPYQPRIRSPRPRSHVDLNSDPASSTNTNAEIETSTIQKPKPTQTLWDRVSSEILGSQSSQPPGWQESYRSHPSANARPPPQQHQQYHQQQLPHDPSRPFALAPPENNYYHNHPGEYVFSDGNVEEDNIDYERLQSELDKRDQQAKQANLETLSQIFPSLDAELAALILDNKQGDLSGTIDTLLEMGSS
ncbi:Vacuolar assembly/sorting protein VPS9 [Phaffia rhodozyma]|uniref:Vacuolar assembly/sorting protein VPS9 n=1 Tax=Phaffia rhodozyma TaxID=264483 RepID=A0A0F7SLH5_PHARH|nr:Vacuolar assembly/sorting protein VPS9 [Phaffia rhodozyma]